MSVPNVSLELRLPGGRVVAISNHSSTETVSVPSGSDVEIIATASDAGGVTDIQLWVDTQIEMPPPPGEWVPDRNITPNRPAVSDKSSDGSAAPQRRISYRIAPWLTDKGRLWYRVWAIGVNAQGGESQAPGNGQVLVKGDNSVDRCEAIASVKASLLTERGALSAELAEADTADEKSRLTQQIRRVNEQIDLKDAELNACRYGSPPFWTRQ